MTAEFPDAAPVGDGTDPESSTLSRREFVRVLGAGLLISVSSDLHLAAGEPGRRRPGGSGPTIAARLHLGKDGAITVLTGKVDLGQGARTEISQAAAEELRVPVERIRLVMGDTALCPDDGITAGSRTTPSTIPAVRAACAAARELLRELASERWQVSKEAVVVADGVLAEDETGRRLGYADLAGAADVVKAFERPVPPGVTLTPVAEWKVLGESVPKATLRDMVTGAHRFPSDIVRPGMLRGKVLRPPAYGARLGSIDVAKAKALDGVVVVQDGDLVGCAAPTTHRARQGLEALAAGALWEPAAHPSSSGLFEHLRARARGRGAAGQASAMGRAAKRVRAEYRTAYIQHAPMETRAAVAEWDGDRVTIWTGSQAPFGVRSEVARALRLPEASVRVIIPDAGGGFGGKHTGEYAVEAARLARAAGRPVSLQWTREEEFTWAYYRPAALIDIEAGLDDKGAIVAWEFTNFNSGGAAIATPYEVQDAKTAYVPCDAPMRHGSYRTLAATANNFAREGFMDELAAAAGSDPLSFRLAHLRNERLRAVLVAATKRFGWEARRGERIPDAGIGLACGTEKGSYVAACAEVRVDRTSGEISVVRVTEVFECGAVLNPENLLSQVQGCIIMGLGGALTEEIAFEGGKVLTDRFSKYRVPRFRDVPRLDIELLDRPDLESAGGGETPIIAVAPAVANAVFDATGVRLRSLPLRDPALRRARGAAPPDGSG